MLTPVPKCFFSVMGGGEKTFIFKFVFHYFLNFRSGGRKTLPSASLLVFCTPGGGK